MKLAQEAVKARELVDGQGKYVSQFSSGLHLITN